MSIQKRFDSFEEYYDNLALNIIENCVECGECIRACQVFPFTPIKDEPPEDIIDKIIDFLKNSKFYDEVYLKAFSCAGCESCIDVCPQELDSLGLHELLKIRLIKIGKSVPEGVNFVLPKNMPNLIKVISALQMKPSGARWITKAPFNAPHVENVVFLGCSSLAVPDKIFAFLDILERMDIEFIALSGGELCCGVMELLAGQVNKAEESAKELISNIQAFSPKRLILYCPTCYKMFSRFYPMFFPLDFEVEFYPQFLNKNIEKLVFSRPLNKKVVINDPCPLARSCADTESIRRLVNSIPGIELIEMPHNRKDTLCCGALTHITYPDLAKEIAKRLMDEVNATGAEMLINFCSFCSIALGTLQRYYSFSITEPVVLINTAMGGKEYEDKLKKYRECKNIEEIINLSRPYFEANGLKEEDIRDFINAIFS